MCELDPFAVQRDDPRVLGFLQRREDVLRRAEDTLDAG
jgi:hypothetical protein